MLRSIAVVMALCFVTVTAQAALLGRSALTPGGTDYQAYYDTDTDLTWVADANLAKTSGYDTDGQMTWTEAQAWIGSLNTANYLGTNDWRLPTVGPINGSTFNYSASLNGSTDSGHNQSEQGTAYAGSTGSEMAYLFYNTLNNKSVCGPADCSIFQTGWGLGNSGPFSNIQSRFYWSGTEYAPNTSNAWIFNFHNGNQNDLDKSNAFYAWAVSPGDSLAVVPVPAAVWLFGSALGLMGVMRRKISG